MSRLSPDSVTTAALRSALGPLAHPRKHPDGTDYTSLPTAAVSELARRFDVTGADVELEALAQRVVPERYTRNMHSLTPADQIRLLNAHVAVVGLGGLGGGVVESLARIGVGHLTLIDGDRFDDSNLNRQFLSSATGLNQPKAEAALKRVARINPSITVSCHADFLDENNARNLIAGADVAVDCLDNLKTRFILERAAKRAGIPMVSAAVAGAAGQITTILPEDEGLSQIYGPETEVPPKGAETRLGCLAQGVSLFSALECAEVVKLLLGRGTPLRGRMLIVDLWDNTFEVLTLV